MEKGHMANQTFDEYWMDYSALCNKHAHTHSELAPSPGVQELIRLLFVLNSRLTRSEFGLILQSAIEQQSKMENDQTRKPSSMRRNSMRTGLRSARDAVTTTSDEPIMEVQLTRDNTNSTSEFKEHIRKLSEELSFAVNGCDSIKNNLENSVTRREGSNSTIDDAIEELKNVDTRMNSLRDGIQDVISIVEYQKFESCRWRTKKSQT